MRFVIQTLGCKINQYESQALREAWVNRGWLEVKALPEADVVLVHTCAVTAAAVADSRGTVRRAGREAPAARLLVTGCAAQTESATFEAIPGVAAIIAQAQKPGLRFWPEALPESDRQGWPDFSITRFNRARPILKVQDGCSHGCTYCIVPRARGPARSRPFPEIVAEARRLLTAGHRELILSGINLGQFSLGDGDFWDMVASLETALAPEWAEQARFRLSSLDPGMLGPKALEVLAGSRMICPHLHLSMQSADAGVLSAMGRSHYDPNAVLGFLESLRHHWPAFAVGADILTGFPGESEAAFQTTLDFCEQARLSYAHVFPYSRRPGTVAAKSRDQLPTEVKKLRAALLRQTAAGLEEQFLGQVVRLPRLVMAVERTDPGTGASEYYMECRLDRPSPVPSGGLLPVRPLRVEGGVVLVEPLTL